MKQKTTKREQIRIAFDFKIFIESKGKYGESIGDILERLLKFKRIK